MEELLGPYAVAVILMALGVLALLLVSRFRYIKIGGGGGVLAPQAAAARIDIPAWFRLAMQALISLVVLAVALYVIVKAADEGSKKWGIGAAGTIVGFWLRGV